MTYFLNEPSSVNVISVRRKHGPRNLRWLWKNDEGELPILQDQLLLGGMPDRELGGPQRTVPHDWIRARRTLRETRVEIQGDDPRVSRRHQPDQRREGRSQQSPEWVLAAST